MGRTVAEVKAAVTEREFAHWRAKFAREPDPAEQLSWWMGQVLALLLNVHRGRGTRPVRAADLTPDPWGERAGTAPAGPARFRGKDLHDMLKAMAGVRDRVA